MLPVPSGDRSAGAAGARLCAWWLGSRSWRSCCCVSNRPSLPSSSKPLHRCCPNLSTAVVVSSPSLVSPPATQGSPVLFPPSCCGCGLHTARSLPPLPHSKEHLDPSRPKAQGQELRFHPFVLLGKGLARAGGPLASQQGALDVFGAQTAGTNGMGTSPAGTAARGALLIACLSSAPCQRPEVESFWEDLRGPRVTW